MNNERLKPASIIVSFGIALIAVGLVLQTFADTAGLYCFAGGVLMILIFIAMKIGELGRREERRQ